MPMKIGIRRSIRFRFSGTEKILKLKHGASFHNVKNLSLFEADSLFSIVVVLGA